MDHRRRRIETGGRGVRADRLLMAEARWCLSRSQNRHMMSPHNSTIMVLASLVITLPRLRSVHACCHRRHHAPIGAWAILLALAATAAGAQEPAWTVGPFTKPVGANP